MAKSKVTSTTVSTESAVPTEQYYFPMKDKVYFGNDAKHEVVSDMRLHPYSDVEAEANRLNEQHGLVQPVDEDYRLNDENPE